MRQPPSVPIPIINHTVRWPSPTRSTIYGLYVRDGGGPYRAILIKGDCFVLHGAVSGKVEVHEKPESPPRQEQLLNAEYSRFTSRSNRHSLKNSARISNRLTKPGCRRFLE